MESFEVFANNKGNASILFLKNVYRFLRQNKSGIVWRCASKSCCVTITTDEKIKTILKSSTNVHKHESSNVNTKLQNIKEICKQNAVDNIYGNPSNIIRKGTSVVTANAANGVASTHFISCLKRSIYREQRKRRPSLPNSQKETFNKLKNMDFKTANGERIVHLFKNEKIIVITCKFNLCFLVNETHVVFADGSTTLRPRSFYQQYTIHGLVRGHYIPLVVCILPSNNKTCYEAMWRILKCLCSKIANCSLNLTLLLLNLEIDAHYAAQTVFPNVMTKVSRFHIKQAWDRKINSNIVLSRAYNSPDESQLGKYLKLFGGLSYLPPNLIHRTFLKINSITEAPECDKFITFSKYIFHNFIKNDAIFPPSMWAGEPNDTLRETYFAEMHYQHLSNKLKTSRPNIFDMLDVLLLHQGSIEFQIQTIRNGNNSTPQDKKCDREEKLKNIYLFFASGEITVMDYLREISNL